MCPCSVGWVKISKETCLPAENSIVANHGQKSSLQSKSNWQKPEYGPDVVFQNRCSELRVGTAEGPHQLPRPGEVCLRGGWGGAGHDGQLLRVVVQPVHRGGGEVGGRRVHALTHLYVLRPLYLSLPSFCSLAYTGITAPLDRIVSILFIWHKHLLFKLADAEWANEHTMEMVLFYHQQRCPAACQEQPGRLFGILGRCGDGFHGAGTLRPPRSPREGDAGLKSCSKLTKMTNNHHLCRYPSVNLVTLHESIWLTLIFSI